MDKTLVKITPNLSKLPNYMGLFRFKGLQGREMTMLIMIIISSIPEYANAAIDFIEGSHRFF